MNAIDKITVGKYNEDGMHGYVFLEVGDSGYSTALVIGEVYPNEWYYGWVTFIPSETEELLGLGNDGMAYEVVCGKYDERGMSCGMFDAPNEAIRDAYADYVEDDDELLVFIRDTVAKGEEERKETRK